MEWTAETIKEHRLERGLTQAQLAKLIDAAPRTVTSWEGGTARPQGRFLHALDKVLLDPKPVAEADIRDLDDDELWERKREADREIERRFFHRHRRPTNRTPGRGPIGSFADPPEHLRRHYPEENGQNPPDAVSSEG